MKTALRSVKTFLAEPDTVRDLTAISALALLFVGTCGRFGFFTACIVAGAVLLFLVVKGTGK